MERSREDIETELVSLRDQVRLSRDAIESLVKSAEAEKIRASRYRAEIRRLKQLTAAQGDLLFSTFYAQGEIAAWYSTAFRENDD